MIKNLIFDLDGTLLDTLPPISKAINITLKHYKLKYKVSVKECRDYIGYGTPYLLKSAFHNEDRDDYDEAMKYYIKKQIITHKEKVKAFKDMIPSLKSLKKKGYKLFIATNKPYEIATLAINKVYGNNFFIDMEAQKKDTPKKPDPYVINEIIRRNKLKRKECIYIGDHECDVRTSINAKIPCLILKHGYGHLSDPVFKKAKKIINSPKDIIKYLK